MKEWIILICSIITTLITIKQFCDKKHKQNIKNICLKIQQSLCNNCSDYKQIEQNKENLISKDILPKEIINYIFDKIKNNINRKIANYKPLCVNFGGITRVFTIQNLNGLNERTIEYQKYKCEFENFIINYIDVIYNNDSFLNQQDLLKIENICKEKNINIQQCLQNLLNN